MRYSTLVGEMAKRGIKKKEVAQSLGICDKSLNNKINCRAPFTWPEVYRIRSMFFPDMTSDELFALDYEAFRQSNNKEE